MQLRITIDTGNDAFSDNTEDEIMRILHRFIDRMGREEIAPELPLLDYNGNKVGQAIYTE